MHVVMAGRWSTVAQGATRPKPSVADVLQDLITRGEVMVVPTRQLAQTGAAPGFPTTPGRDPAALRALNRHAHKIRRVANIEIVLVAEANQPRLYERFPLENPFRKDGTGHSTQRLPSTADQEADQATWLPTQAEWDDLTTAWLLAATNCIRLVTMLSHVAHLVYRTNPLPTAVPLYDHAVVRGATHFTEATYRLIECGWTHRLILLLIQQEPEPPWGLPGVASWLRGERAFDLTARIEVEQARRVPPGGVLRRSNPTPLIPGIQPCVTRWIWVLQYAPRAYTLVERLHCISTFIMMTGSRQVAVRTIDKYLLDRSRSLE